MENRATEMSNKVQKSFTFEEYEDPKQSLNVSIPEVLAHFQIYTFAIWN